MKQKKIDEIGRKLFPNDASVVAWGDAQFNQVHRGLPAGTSSAIYKRLKKRYAERLRLCPEFRTSCVCCLCNERMLNPSMRNDTRTDGAVRVRRATGLYQCVNHTCHKLWNRDRNAALNIWRVYNDLCHGGELPDVFRRNSILPEVSFRRHLAGKHTRPPRDASCNRGALLD
jgi:hypothetical protein